MSATVADLLHRLQQEAAEAVAPAPGTIALAPLVLSNPSSANDGGYHTVYSSDYSGSVSLYQYHGREFKWAGQERRADEAGRTWERRLYAAVDDFGELVEVSP